MSDSVAYKRAYEHWVRMVRILQFHEEAKREANGNYLKMPALKHITGGIDEINNWLKENWGREKS